DEVKRTATWSSSDRRIRSQGPALPAATCRVSRTAGLMVSMENDGNVTRRRLFSRDVDDAGGAGHLAGAVLHLVLGPPGGGVVHGHRNARALPPSVGTRQ